MLLHGTMVSLRPVRDTDLRDLYELFSDPRSWGDFEDIHAVDWFTFEKDAREVGQNPEKSLGFLIETNADHAVIGLIFYNLRETGLKNHEIGYAIFKPEARGKGYGTEAVHLMVDYLFATRNIERIEAYTDVDNVASHAVLKHSGFRLEGTMRRARWISGRYRDYLVFGLIREDWKPFGR